MTGLICSIASRYSSKYYSISSRLNKISILFCKFRLSEKRKLIAFYAQILLTPFPLYRVAIFNWNSSFLQSWFARLCILPSESNWGVRLASIFGNQRIFIERFLRVTHQPSQTSFVRQRMASSHLFAKA